MFQECSIKKTINSDNIFRLGQLDKNNSTRSQAKVRPLKLVTDRKAEKWKIVKRINALKQKGVFIRLDLNQAKRLEDFRFCQKLTETREKFQTETFKIRGEKVIRLTTLVLLSNVLSVKGKLSEIQVLFSQFNIICLTETHLDSLVPDTMLFDAADKQVLGVVL